MKLPKRLLWVDLETEGLGDKVQVLEIALVVTDNRLNELATFNHIIMPKGLTLDDYVLKMHVKNGLLADLKHGKPVADVDVFAAGWAHAHGVVGGPAAGQSVHTDTAWMATHMPLLRKCFNHRVFDVSTLKLANMIECAIDDSGEDSSTAAHRALDDIRYSIRCARMYLGLE